LFVVGAILPALSLEAYNGPMRPELLKLAAGFAEREERFAIVTVVRREPPSSAHVGDVALVTERGEYHGWTGGGCTRSSVLLEAMRAIADGKPRLLSLSPEPEGGRRPGVVFLPMTCESGGTVEIYVEPVLPSARLVLFGGSPAVRVLSRIAHAMGYRVDVVDPDADESAFPGAKLHRAIAPDALPRGAHVLVATMGDKDLEAVEAALSRSPAYLGVIASAKRFALLREALLARGVLRESLESVAAPAGLDIGARTPEEIAVSIMAQIVERRNAASKGRSAPASEKPREAVDPVCGMSVAVAGARHTAEVLGVAYYFCCAGCRTKFLAEPARFVGAGSKAVGS
jgi:xanthine dehydrogenase accessory factor